MRLALIVLATFLFVAPAFAAEETKETKPLSELQALRIKVLVLERQMIEAQAARVQAQAALQYQEKARALDAAVEAAAQEAGVALKVGWQPDLDAQVWRKGK